MEFYDPKRQLTPEQTADELYRYAQRLAALVASSEAFTMPRDVTDLLGSTYQERLDAFRRARLTNAKIEDIETKMAQEAFGTVIPSAETAQEQDRPASTDQNSSDEAR